MCWCLESVLGSKNVEKSQKWNLNELSDWICDHGSHFVSEFMVTLAWIGDRDIALDRSEHKR